MGSAGGQRASVFIRELAYPAIADKLVGRGQVSTTRDFASEVATVAFIDLAGFSAIADVYGDVAAMSVLEGFESMVGEALSGHQRPIKWIGDEAMLAFP